jgi:major vault protein
MPAEGRDRDLVLAPGEFAHILDTTKGIVNVIVGPYKLSLSNTDQPVTWDPQNKRFNRLETGDRVITQVFPNASEGSYLVLENPADGSRDDEHPRIGNASQSQKLKLGRKVNIPGPCTFPLWPQQAAKVVLGHQLRSNEFLFVRVYNEEEAKRNWANAVVKTKAVQSDVKVPATTVPQGSVANSNPTNLFK